MINREADDTFLIEDTSGKNPNPELYVRGKNGKYMLKPKQCFWCTALFTPKKEDQTECGKCDHLTLEE